MRIIDNKKDYYDYLSKIYKDDYFTLDRRGSYYLENYFESIITPYADNSWLKKYKSSGYFLLRIGYSNWIIEVNLNSFEFSYSLLNYFKDFTKPYKFQLGLIRIYDNVEKLSFLDGSFEKKRERIKKNLENDVKTNNFTLRNAVGFDLPEKKCTLADLPSEKYVLFDKCCISKLIKADDIYRAFEDYFSAIKTEKNVDNRTNDEHIITHGFDTKESFRNIKEN